MLGFFQLTELIDFYKIYWQLDPDNRKQLLAIFIASSVLL